MDHRSMKDANPNPHPKDEPQGASFWAREGYWYVCGDRKRGTVLFIMPHGVLEMTPEAARAMADEFILYASDVRSDSASRDQEQT